MSNISVTYICTHVIINHKLMNNAMINNITQTTHYTTANSPYLKSKFCNL